MQFKLDVNDNRSGIRLDFKLPVELYYPEKDIVVHGVMVNVSVHGMLLELTDEHTTPPCSVKDECTAKVVFSGHGSRLVIEDLHAQVVRIVDNQLAIQFIKPLEWFLLFNVYKGRQLR